MLVKYVGVARQYTRYYIMYYYSYSTLIKDEYSTGNIFKVNNWLYCDSHVSF